MLQAFFKPKQITYFPVELPAHKKELCPPVLLQQHKANISFKITNHKLNN